MPKEEPIKKQALLLPDSFTSFSLAAKLSLESSFPSGVKMQNQAPLGILPKIVSASFSRPVAITVTLQPFDIFFSGAEIKLFFELAHGYQCYIKHRIPSVIILA